MGKPHGGKTTAMVRLCLNQFKHAGISKQFSSLAQTEYWQAHMLGGALVAVA